VIVPSKAQRKDLNEEIVDVEWKRTKFIKLETAVKNLKKNKTDIECASS
jgi:hypothetical protein